MDKSMLLGILLGVGGATAGGAIAGYAVFSQKDSPAPAATQVASAALASTPMAAQVTQRVEQAQVVPVLSVNAITETSRIPQQQCHQKTVVHRRPVQDEHRITGTVIGGALGGVVGNQIGKGNGRDVARVAGIIAGGYAGNRVQKNLQENDTYSTTERSCTTVTRTRSKTVGYDVTYQLDGVVKTVRMDKHPGQRVLVNQGEVIALGRNSARHYD